MTAHRSLDIAADGDVDTRARVHIVVIDSPRWQYYLENRCTGLLEPEVAEEILLVRRPRGCSGATHDRPDYRP
jgi:hypothetical protein